MELGIDRMSGYMQRFGFGEPTGIDLLGEAVGIRPTQAWKRATRNQAWYPGETVIAGIGQGFWVATPLQLAQATSMLAAGGVRHPLHLLRQTQAGFDAPLLDVPQPPVEASVISRPQNLQAVIDGMVAAVHGHTGSAREMGLGASYRMAGKTGTAQRVSRIGDEARDQSTLTQNQRNQSDDTESDDTESDGTESDGTTVNATESKPAAADKRACDARETLNDADAKFCKSCGKTLSPVATATDDTPAPAPPPTSTRA